MGQRTQVLVNELRQAELGKVGVSDPMRTLATTLAEHAGGTKSEINRAASAAVVAYQMAKAHPSSARLLSPFVLPGAEEAGTAQPLHLTDRSRRVNTSVAMNHDLNVFFSTRPSSRNRSIGGTVAGVTEEEHLAVGHDREHAALSGFISQRYTVSPDSATVAIASNGDAHDTDGFLSARNGDSRNVGDHTAHWPVATTREHIHPTLGACSAECVDLTANNAPCPTGQP